jgi:hypothetical protein
MAYSTIPQAKAQMLTTLSAVGGLTGVLVARGLPPPDKPTPDLERVYINNAVDIVRDWMMVGRRRLDESYTVRIHVEVFQYDPDSDPVNQAICEDRMWAIVALVEQAVIADLTLAGILNGNTERPTGVKPGGIEDENSFVNGDGWISHAVLRIDCAARI